MFVWKRKRSGGGGLMHEIHIWVSRKSPALHPLGFASCGGYFFGLVCLTQPLSHTHTRAHTHTHTQTISLSFTHSLSISHSLTISLTHTHSHSLSHTLSFYFSLSYTHILSLPLSHSLCHDDVFVHEGKCKGTRHQALVQQTMRLVKERKILGSFHLVELFLGKVEKNCRKGRIKKKRGS